MVEKWGLIFIFEKILNLTKGRTISTWLTEAAFIDPHDSSGKAS
jgi:hypothetical protein